MNFSNWKTSTGGSLQRMCNLGSLVRGRAKNHRSLVNVLWRFFGILAFKKHMDFFWPKEWSVRTHWVCYWDTNGKSICGQKSLQTYSEHIIVLRNCHVLTCDPQSIPLKLLVPTWYLICYISDIYGSKFWLWGDNFWKKRRCRETNARRSEKRENIRCEVCLCRSNLRTFIFNIVCTDQEFKH